MTESGMEPDNDTANVVEYNDARPAIIGAQIILNLTVNTCVIAVLTRYPQLREDRTALFILSQTVADLANGCVAMPVCAAICSRVTSSILHETRYLPKINVLAFWWFGIVSLYSLCWMTMSKAIAIIMPFRSDQILSRRRCHIIITMTWVIGFILAAVNFKVESTWNTSICTYRYPSDSKFRIFILNYFIVAAILPRCFLVYGTVRIFIVVLRTHRQVTAQAQSIGVAGSGSGQSGTVTGQAIRSSVNILVICVVSIVLSTPLFIFQILFSTNHTTFPVGFPFAAIWLMQLNTILDSLLYLLMFRSVRKKTGKMLRELVMYIRGRDGNM